MAGNKYLKNVSGTITEQAATQSSAGAGDAGAIPALDAAGRLDVTMMPVGVGAEVQSVTTSEALAAGDLVNIWNSTGAKARKADASTSGKEAHGFVLASYGSGATAVVYAPSNANTGVTGLTPGVQYLSTTPGLATATAPSSAGNVVQRVGVATAATVLVFMPAAPVVLA